MNWCNLVRDRTTRGALVNTVMDLWVPLKAEDILTILEAVSFSRRTLFHGVNEQDGLHPKQTARRS